MVTPTKTLRLKPKLRAGITRIAKKTNRSFSEVAQMLLEEALRMRECPGIYFADEPAGRDAKVAGTGLGVWEIMRDYLGVGRDLRRFRKAMPFISEAQLQAALLYYERYRREIDAEIRENKRAYEALKRLPFARSYEEIMRLPVRRRA